MSAPTTPAEDPTPGSASSSLTGADADQLDAAAVVPGATVSRIAAYIEDRLGQGALDRVLDLAQRTSGRDGLDDVTRTFTYGEATALLRAACTVLGVPGAARLIGEGRDVAIDRIMSPAVTSLYELIRSFPTPREAMRVVPMLTPRYTPMQRSAVLELTDGGAIVAVSPLGVPGARDRRLWCGFTAGMLAVPARALGHHVEVTETACEADGDDRCVFSVRWWATPEDQQLQIDAMRRRLDVATRQLELLQEVPGDLVADVGLDVLLDRIVDRARHAVLGSAHVLVLRRDDADGFDVHAAGLDALDAELLGHRIMASDGAVDVADPLDDNRLVVDVATARRTFGRLAVIRTAGEPVFFAQEVRLLDAFARTAAAALEIAGALDAARDEALRDRLTGLPNRRLFQDRLDQALSFARRRGHTGAVVVVGLDDFRAVNDTFGHATGDEALMRVGARISAILRGTDTVARLAGDEFTILLPEVADADALDRVTSRVCAAFDDPFPAGGQEVRLHASIGVACFPESGDTVRAVVARARAEMAAMKRALRDTSWWGSPEESTGD